MFVSQRIVIWLSSQLFFFVIACKSLSNHSTSEPSATPATFSGPIAQGVFGPEYRRIPVLQVSYETGTIDAGVTNLLVVPPSNPVAVTITDSARTGQFALKTTVGSSEDYVTAGKPRAETATLKIPTTRYSASEKWEYGFSLKLDGGWVVDSSGAAEIIWQFKRFDTSSTQLPPDMFVAVKREFVVLRSQNHQINLVDLAKFPPGQWMDFRIYVLWSNDSNGLTEVWFKPAAAQNFEKVATVSGPNMGDARPKSGYIKWGIYRPECLPTDGKPCSTATFNPRVVYHDEITATLIEN